MTDQEINTLNADCVTYERAAAALERMADAVARLNCEMAWLAGKEHGGVLLRIIGELMTAEVKPA